MNRMEPLFYELEKMINRSKKTGFLLVIFALLLHSSVSYAQPKYTIYIYSFKDLQSTPVLLSHFSEYGCEVILYDLNEPSNHDKFLEIMETIRMSGIPVIPKGICATCELLHRSWNKILTAYNSPLIGIFHNGRLVAVTFGTVDLDILNKALNVSGESVKIFSYNDEYSMSDGDVRNKLEKLFLGSRVSISIEKILPSLVLLALADSINPCTFILFTAILLITLHSLGKTKTTVTGLSFISAIFICYYILGLGLIHILTRIPYVNVAVALIGMALGIFNITRGLKPNFKSPIPKFVRRFLEVQIRKSYLSPLASFLLGAAASFTLLPCSGGPYLVGTGLLSTLNDQFKLYPLLAFYNALFVTPLIAVLLIILASQSYVRKIKIFRREGSRFMELISGSILFMICTYLLLFPS